MKLANLKRMSEPLTDTLGKKLLMVITMLNVAVLLGILDQLQLSTEMMFFFVIGAIINLFLALYVITCIRDGGCMIYSTFVTWISVFNGLMSMYSIRELSKRL